MHKPPRILVVDDQPQNVEVLKDRLEGHGYEMLMATSGEVALDMAMTQRPDLILLDVIMPGMDGLEVCRRLKENVELPFMPVIMVTAKSGTSDLLSGLEAGADEYLTKPLDQVALVARVKSMLRLKSFHDRVWDQANQLEAEVEALENRKEVLEERVEKQRRDLERLGMLKRFISPQLVECVLTLGAEEFLSLQRREVTVLSCVIHGLTSMVDRMEPEIAFDVLRDCYKSIGHLFTRYDGMLVRNTGDELLVVFNAPLVCSEPILGAVDMARAIRQQLDKHADEWRSSGYALDFGIGIANGEATVGIVDLYSHWDYDVMGIIPMLASRLGATAESGKIFVSQSVYKEIDDLNSGAPAGEITLAGQGNPEPFFEVGDVIVPG